jgi:uncharacterized protein
VKQEFRQSQPDNLKDLVGYVAKSLVNDPSQVDVRRRETNSAVILELRVAPEDVGRVIGKDGRVANAIRSLLRVADQQQRGRKRIILEIQ